MTKEKYAWAGLAIPLSWLAELDNVAAPNALADAFGDRYLYRHNPVFAAIRDSALELGYRFSTEDTPLWRDYQSLGLVALHRILATRVIPYFNTGATFRRMLDANPAARLPPGFIAGNLKRNYAFHESAHCVAHSIMSRMQAELRAAAPGEAGSAVLEAILAESFANTVEALGSVVQHLPLSDGIFFRLNSYFSQSQTRRELLARAGAELGPENGFTLLFAAYFEANLALEPPAGATYERIAEAAGCGAKRSGLAKDTAGECLQIECSLPGKRHAGIFRIAGLDGANTPH